VAHDRFPCEVLTPEGEVFNDEVEMVSTRTESGEIGILARHQPLLGLLRPTDLRLYRTETDVVHLAQGEGYVQVSENGVLLLVQEAIRPEDLDAADLRSRIGKAEQAVADAEDGSEAQQAARRDLRRNEAFLRVAEGRSLTDH
jgi:F-type H+-transporting ATPase subunit epsilon